MDAKQLKDLTDKVNMLEAHIIRAANNGQYSMQVTLIDKNFDTDLLVQDGFKVIKNWNGDLIISWEIEKPTKPQLNAKEAANRSELSMNTKSLINKIIATADKGFYTIIESHLSYNVELELKTLGYVIEKRSCCGNGDSYYEISWG